MISFATITSIGEKYATVQVEKVTKEESKGEEVRTFEQSILFKALKYATGRELNIGDRITVEHSDDSVRKVFKDMN